MLYRFLADSVLVFHFCFVLFVILGGILILRWRYTALLHLPAVIWGILVECFQLICPLTPLENYFRQLGGESGYSGGFIDHYVSALLYSRLSPQFQFILALLLIAINLLIYWYVFIVRNKKTAKMS